MSEEVALKLDSYNYGMDFQMGNRFQDIFSTYKKNGVFAKNQEKTPSFPSQVKDPSCYKLHVKKALDFAHLGKTKTSLVHILEKPEEALCYMKDEAEVFNKVYQSYCQLSYNIEHKEMFNLERSNYSTEDLTKHKYLWDFKNFIQDVHKKVYNKIYGIEGNFTNDIPCEARNITNYMFNSQSLLFDDLTNELALKTVLSMSKIIDEITDDETTNCFIMNSHSFLHPINHLLSPAALSVSFFNSQQVALKKLHRDEYYYSSKRSLPSVTYLNISGIYSEIDIDILHEFSENIQTIMVYDENTGGPSILSKGEYRAEVDGRKNPRDFHTISDKLLLIPLKCDKNRKEKSYSQNDILSIIEQMVVGAIAKFKPSYVVLNCSLVHSDESKTPFCIDGNTLGKIIQLISVLSDQKIIVYPFKLPDLTTNKNNQEIFERSQGERSQYIFNKYAIPYQPKFLLDCFVNCIEALADMKEDNAWERTAMRRLAGENPLRSQVLYMVGRHYKNHSYYNFLYSKTLAPLAVSSRKYLGVDVSVPNTKAKPLSYLPFYSMLEKLETRKLEVDRGRLCEVVIEENSQYLVDYYSDKSNPTVYVFNARIAEKTYGITTYGPLCHAAFQVDLEELAFREHFSVTETPAGDTMMRKDCGICKCESLVFQVYGTQISNNKDTNDIYYFDFESSECFKLEIKGEKREILPRHGVTACAFQREGRYYLYVFGGQVQNDVVYGNKRLGSLDVIDIVEVYSTENLRTGGWDYKILQKSDLTKDEKISFIPFQNSFAHYDEKRDEILLMGGSQFVNSVYEWNFPVFVFDVKAERFVKFDMFLNDAKGNLKRKTVNNDPYAMPVVPIPIADQNKNFFYDEKSGTFEFVVLNRFNKIGCKYSYNRETNDCDFTQALLKLNDKDDDVKRISPPKLNETENSEKIPPLPLEISKKLSLFLTSLSQKRFFLETILWRMEIKQEVISREELENYLASKKKQIQEGEDENSILDQIKLPYQMDQIDQLFQTEYIQNLFLKKSPELEGVKKYLLFDCDWVEVKYEMKSAENSTHEDYPMDKTNPLNVAKLDITVQNQTVELESSSNKVDEMSMSFSKPPSSSSFIVVEGEGLKKKDESGSGSGSNSVSVIEESKSKDYSIIESSQILEKSDATILVNNPSPDKNKSKDYSIIETSRSLQQSYSRIVSRHPSLENFKECLMAQVNSPRVFINKAKNGIAVVKDDNHSVCQNLLFKVNVKDELEGISFSQSPSSVTVFRGAIVCYIDQQFKISHSDIYQEYKNWILYADLNSILSSTENGRKSIILERLIQLNTDDHIFNRSLLANEESLFLFGGKSVKYKGKQRVVYHKSLSRYDLKKLTDSNQTASEIRDTDIDDEMENNKGECAVVYAGDFIYVCQKNSPQNLEIFAKDGVLEENIELKINTEGWTAFMNPVLFEEKPHILITLCKVDEDMRFALYDVTEKVLVTENVTIVPKDKEVIQHPLFYSGFEEIEVSVTGEFKNEILIYNYRGDSPKIVPYVVQM